MFHFHACLDAGYSIYLAICTLHLMSFLSRQIARRTDWSYEGVPGRDAGYDRLNRVLKAPIPPVVVGSRFRRKDPLGLVDMGGCRFITGSCGWAEVCPELESRSTQTQTGGFLSRFLDKSKVQARS